MRRRGPRPTFRAALDFAQDRRLQVLEIVNGKTVQTLEDVHALIPG